MMTDPTDFLELLLESMVKRVKATIQEDLHMMVADAVSNISADRINGLEIFVEHAMDEWQRNGIKVDADDIAGLDNYIKDLLKEATIDIDFNF